MDTAAFVLSLLLAASLPLIARAGEERAPGATVIGPLNALLSDGADALEQGHTDEGIRLTLEGLKQPNAVHDTAAAHANLCGGYALLQRWEEALAHCNTSIELDQNNWRAYNNRAAVFAARGLYERALADVETGLKLAPNSYTLHKTLEVIHNNQRIEKRRARSGSKA